MRLTSLAAALALGVAALPAAASDEVDHYAAEESETLAEALTVLDTYNAKVAEVIARDDLSVSDMEEVHEYTYSMEKAVARIATEMEEIAVVLEEVHQSSEGDDPAVLRENTENYLDMTAPLTE